jgi:hypothetical protein
MTFIPKRGICGCRLPLLWDFYHSHQIFFLNHTRAPVFCLNVAKLQQIQGASNAGESHAIAGGVEMTVPLVHGSKSVGSLREPSSKAGKRKWLDDRSPMATVAVGVLLILVWMGALIGFYLLFARHF